jgi:hypothetical protein
MVNVQGVIGGSSGPSAHVPHLSIDLLFLVLAFKEKDTSVPFRQRKPYLSPMP